MDNQNEQITKILKITEETNRLVKRMESRHKVSSFFRFIYICLFLYLSWWGYKQILPYLDQIKALVVQVQEMSKTADEMSQKVNNVKANISPEVQKLLDKLPK